MVEGFGITRVDKSRQREFFLCLRLAFTLKVTHARIHSLTPMATPRQRIRLQSHTAPAGDNPLSL